MGQQPKAFVPVDRLRIFKFLFDLFQHKNLSSGMGSVANEKNRTCAPRFALLISSDFVIQRITLDRLLPRLANQVNKLLLVQLLW